MNEQTLNRVWVAGFIGMAVALHIQPTVALGGGEVRVSLSDLVTFPVAPFVFWLAWTNRSLWNRRETWVAMTLVAAGSVVMTIGLVRAGLSSQGVSDWALIKSAGWYVLVYYGVLGVMAMQLAPKTAIEWFIRVFVLIHAALVFTFIVLNFVGSGWPTPESPRFTGLVVNPNAYALSLICGLGLLLGFGERLFPRMPGYRFEILCAVICTGVLFTRSLAGLAGLAAIGAIFLVTRRDIVQILRVACITLALYATPWAGNALFGSAGLKVGDSYPGIGSKLLDPDKYAFSLSARLESNGRAIALWKESPVLGAGLGVFYEKEKASAPAGRLALQVHNTLLWILAEFGLIGAFVFAAMGLSALSFLLRAREPTRSDTLMAGFVPAGLMIMGAWMTMSMAHELMYQRLPWFILGMCLGAAMQAGTAGLSDDAISVEPVEPGPRV